MTIPLLLRKSPLFRLVTTLLMLCPVAGANASGILDFGVSKYQRFIQEDANPPESPSESGYLFVASFTIDDPDRTASGTIILPNGKSHDLIRTPFSTSLFHSRVFDTAAELHEVYPFGAYLFNITVDGVLRTASLQLAETPFPGAPYISNYEDLQEVDASAPFTVEWASFSGATTNDFIFLAIEDYESPDPWEPDTLNGADTFAIVDEGILESGVNESVLTFSKVVARTTAAIPGALGVAVVGSWTEFEISATGGLGGFQITTASLPVAKLNQAYATDLQANAPVFLWFVEDEESLPNGIEVNPLTGQLSGIATEAGSFRFTLSAISSSFELATRRLTLTVSLEEASPPVIGGTSFAGGLFSLTVPSPDGRSVAIEVSENMTVWLPLAVVAPVGGMIEFQDAASATSSRRFYRVRWQ